MPCVAPPIPTCIVERLVFTINYLCGVIGEHGRTDRASVPLLNLTCLRLRRLCSRLTRLIAAFREGRLAPPRVRTRRETPPRPPRQEQLRLPSKFGWLLRFGWQAAGSRSQFEHWLEDPEVKALVAASPQARRILRALCHMFGIPLGPALALPRRKRKRARKPDGAGTGAAEGSAGIAPRAAVSGKPTAAEIRSWYPGQKRPMPWSRSPARNAPPLIRPKPKIA